MRLYGLFYGFHFWIETELQFRLDFVLYGNKIITFLTNLRLI